MKVSFYKQDITPQAPLHLAGFGKRYSQADRLGPPQLCYSIAWIQFDEGGSSSHLIFVSLDTLYFPKNMADELRATIKALTGSDHVTAVFNASHTHSAPNLYSEHFGPIDLDYVSYVEDNIKKGLSCCFEGLEDGDMYIESFDFSERNWVNRREIGRDYRHFYLKQSVIIAPNEEGYIDNGCRMFTFYKSNGDFLGGIINFSCHPVCNTTDQFSSDFVGALRLKLEAQFKGSFMFLQGFCGDNRPRYTQRLFSFSSPAAFLKSLALKSVFKPYNLTFFNEFVSRLTADISKHILSKSKKIQDKHIKSNVFNFTFESELGQKKTSAIQLIQLSPTSVMISVSAEVLSSYLQILEQKFPNLLFVPVGFCDDMIGYLPAAKDWTLGGYEIESAPNYGWDSVLSYSNIQRFQDALVSEIERFIDGELGMKKDGNKA